MIMSFGDKETERLFRREPLPKIPADVQERAFFRLRLIHAAASVLFLPMPPSNRLGAPRGNLRGFFSIRVKARGRIIFRFEDGTPFAARFIDYHRN